MYKEIRKIARKAWQMAACLLLTLCVACTEKAPEFPVLEKYWKQERIEDNRTGESQDCKRLFWALQMGVSEIKDLGGNDYGTFLCRYEYDEGASTLRLYDFRLRTDQSEVADESDLAHFGIPSGDVTFDVMQLEDDHMILRSEETTLYFRSF